MSWAWAQSKNSSRVMRGLRKAILICGTIARRDAAVSAAATTAKGSIRVSYRSLRRWDIMHDYAGVRGSRRLPMESGHQIETSSTAYFRHDYDSEHADMRRLYEQAKIDQWNAVTDIDWACPLVGDGGLIAD